MDSVVLIAIRIACFLDINCLIFVDVGVNFHLSTTLSLSRDSPLVPSPQIIQNWISEKSFILISERVWNRDFSNKLFGKKIVDPGLVGLVLG